MNCDKCGSNMRQDIPCSHCAFLASPSRVHASPLGMVYTLLVDASEVGEVFWFEGLKLRHTMSGKLDILN